jgi:hypothetical protein
MHITGRPKTSVYQHIQNIELSKSRIKEIAKNARKRALVLSSARSGIALRPFKPFDEWTPKLILLTSHLIFDGQISKLCAYNNRSVSLISRFKKLMLLVYDFSPKIYINNVTGVYKICYNNVAMANFFKVKVERLLSEITELDKSNQREFLRAFFDDEGCMDFRGNKRRVRGYQKNKKILMIIKNLLKNFNIDSKLEGQNEVVVSGKENLKKFQKEINFSKGVRINPNRTNSIWKKNLEKRKLLDMAIKSFKN